LNLDSIGRSLIVLPNLLVEVQIFLALDWGKTWIFNRFNSVKPLDAASTYVTHHNNPEWIPMNSGQWFSIHFP
jgi:hypothetical protein